MNEEKLEQELEEYRKLAQADTNVDVASLMINALQKQANSSLTVKEKRWAYLLSLALPPLGFFFAAKFYFSDKDDGIQAAMICSVLTVVSILLTVLIAKSLLSGTGVNI